MNPEYGEAAFAQFLTVTLRPGLEPKILDLDLSPNCLAGLSSRSCATSLITPWRFRPKISIWRGPALYVATLADRAGIFRFTSVHTPPTFWPAMLSNVRIFVVLTLLTARIIELFAVAGRAL